MIYALTQIFMWIYNIWDQFEKLKTIHLNTKWYLMSFSKKKKMIFNVIIPKKKKKKRTLQTKKAYS